MDKQKLVEELEILQAEFEAADVIDKVNLIGRAIAALEAKTELDAIMQELENRLGNTMEKVYDLDVLALVEEILTKHLSEDEGGECDDDEEDSEWLDDGWMLDGNGKPYE